MDIHLDRLAQKKADLWIRMKNPRRGFIIGERLGDSLLIQDLMPQPFTAEDLPRIYTEIFQGFPHRLIGPFFFHDSPFCSQWFLGDLMLEFREKNGSLFEYRLQDDLQIFREEIQKFNWEMS